MDRAQARARRQLKIFEVFEDLSKSEDSAISSIAELLLYLVELHKLQLKLSYAVDGADQQLEIQLPWNFAYGFLEVIKDGEALEDISYPVTIYLIQGRWEHVHHDLLPSLENDIDERRDIQLPFSEFKVSKPKLEQRLNDSDIQIPPVWVDSSRSTFRASRSCRVRQTSTANTSSLRASSRCSPFRCHRRVPCTVSSASSR